MNPSRRIQLLLVLLAAASAFTAAAVLLYNSRAAQAADHTGGEPFASFQGVAADHSRPLADVLRPAPAFSLTERSERTVTNAELEGRVWVATFMFTHCPGICKPMTANMAQLQHKLRGYAHGDAVRLVMFSLDPERDTPARLREYADEYGADPEQWLFLTGDKQTIWALANDGFKMGVTDSPNTPINPIAHGPHFALVDQQGQIRDFYDSLDAGRMAQLALDIDRLVLPWGVDLSVLPAVNAALNTVATAMLIVGYLLIRRKRIIAHRNTMISAFGVSCLFLVLYVLHKVWRAQSGGDLHTEYNAQGALKLLYLLILMTHLVLAMLVPIFAIVLIRLGLTGRYETHRRVARWGYPIWLYVSVTGVVIYLMLYHLNPPVS